MEDADELDERHADLQTRIDAARQRLAENSKLDWAEIGSMLEGFSQELDELDEPEAEAKRDIYDRIENGLQAIHARLDTARPTD